MTMNREADAGLTKHDFRMESVFEDIPKNGSTNTPTPGKTGGCYTNTMELFDWKCERVRPWRDLPLWVIVHATWSVTWREAAGWNESIIHVWTQGERPVRCSSSSRWPLFGAVCHGVQVWASKQTLPSSSEYPRRSSGGEQSAGLTWL